MSLGVRHIRTPNDKKMIRDDYTPLEQAYNQRMTAQIRIETTRLILRTVTKDDVEAVAQHWNLDGAPLTREEAEKRVARMLENHAKNRRGKINHLCLAIIRKETGEITGWCGLDHLDRGWPNPALFYMIRKECWGQGYATEAARALVEYALCEMEIPVIDSACLADNLISKRVMEKIGMRYVGVNAEGGHAFTIRSQVGIADL